MSEFQGNYATGGTDLSPPLIPSNISDSEMNSSNAASTNIDYTSSYYTNPSIQSSGGTNHGYERLDENTAHYVSPNNDNIGTAANTLHKDAGISAIVAPEPLSWRSARARMRETLEDYMKDTSFLHVSNNRNNSNNVDGQAGFSASECGKWWLGFLSWLTSHDMDCYAGSILFSLLLMVMSIGFYVVEKQRQDRVGNSNEYIFDVHLSYIVASIIYTMISVLSAWLIRRRRYTSMIDVNLKKRRNVSSLLKVLNKLEEAHEHDEQNPHIRENASVDSSIYETRNILGNSLSDVYSVYRLSSTSQDKNEKAKGHWHKIPSLLLVKGDFIALRTGDIAPADCKLVSTTRSTSSTQENKKGHHKVSSFDAGVIKGGDTVPLPPRVRPDQMRNGVQSLNPLFPPGKSTLPENSRKLLLLCSNKKIFQVLESPITKFLQSDSGETQSCCNTLC